MIQKITKTAYAPKDKLFIAIAALFYAVGVVGFRVNATHNFFTKLTPLILLLSAFFLAYYDKSENRKTLSFYFLFVFIASFLVEMAGTNTGALFGHYRYGSGLGLKIAETPVLIGLNWVLLVYMTAAIAASRPRNPLFQILLPAAWMVGYDAIMEQKAPQMDMWQWAEGIIPLQNYMMWALLALIFHSVIYFLHVKIINKMALPLFILQILFFLFVPTAGNNTNQSTNFNNSDMKNNFYAFSATTLQGDTVSMETYKGKTVLVVNTASKCGLTPQYEGLEKLYQKYKDKGLVILGFPCNQFGNQEPGDEKSIAQGCVLNYGVTFPMFAKVDVNGDNAHPIFKYLKSELGGWFGSRVKWNFTKFLIDKNGKPVKRFSPTTKPESIEKYLEKMIN